MWGWETRQNVQSAEILKIEKQGIYEDISDDTNDIDSSKLLEPGVENVLHNVQQYQARKNDKEKQQEGNNKQHNKQLICALVPLIMRETLSSELWRIITNYEEILKKYLKEVNIKCDECGTVRKTNINLEIHIKYRHWNVHKTGQKEYYLGCSVL